MSDTAFITNFRLNKNVTKKLIKELSPYLKPQMRSSDLDNTTKVSYSTTQLHKYLYELIRNGGGSSYFIPRSNLYLISHYFF